MFVRARWIRAAGLDAREHQSGEHDEARTRVDASSRLRAGCRFCGKAAACGWGTSARVRVTLRVYEDATSGHNAGSGLVCRCPREHPQPHRWRLASDLGQVALCRPHLHVSDALAPRHTGAAASGEGAPESDLGPVVLLRQSASFCFRHETTARWVIRASCARTSLDRREGGWRSGPSSPCCGRCS